MNITRSRATTSLYLFACASCTAEACVAQLPQQQAVPAPPGPASLPATAATSQEQAWGAEESKSYVIPAVEIVAFEFLLNQADRHLGSDPSYETDFSTFWDNLQNGWVMDRDPFGVNQLGHPYSGIVYHNFARSAGLDYWESLAYTFGGSLLWETAGETTRPSINDQVATGIGGSFLGEALFRSASYLLQGGSPGFWPTVGAGVLSPPMAVQHLAFDRFDGIFPSGSPAVSSHCGFGVRKNTFVADSARSFANDPIAATGDFVIDYGLPGKAGYEYARPFDYFHAEISGLSDGDNRFERVAVRGLIHGLGYSSGEGLDGVAGLYGLYDYVSPGVFRVASTSLAGGTTAQLRMSPDVALQGTALAGVGFGAAGSVDDDESNRDYHYGAIPLGIVQLRLVFGDDVMLELGARDWYVFGVNSGANRGSENIAQGEAALTVRVIGSHALRVGYTASGRDAWFPNGTDQQQSLGTFSFTYAFLGETRFGVVR